MALRPVLREEHLGLLVRYVRDFFVQARRDLAIVGMSGGLDSSVVVALCARALGPDRVQGLFLKDEVSPPGDEADARGWAETLGISFTVVDLSPLVEEFRTRLAIEDQVALGNVRARCRMIALYAVSNQRRGLVVGTGNKSEVLTGFFTKFGDGGADLLPLGDLYKTQVRALGRALEVPPAILAKTPTPGLWKGQTDEGELGLPYEDLDRILLGIELGMAAEEIQTRTGLSRAAIGRVEERVRASIHKRKLPLIPKVGVRTVGLDWRE